eukprot:15452336-Alexandrium_andersonii.AAC.1
MDHPRPLVEVATKAAWWQLPRTTVYNFAMRFGLRPSAGSSLFDLLWRFAASVLRLPEEQALEIAHRRVASAADRSEACSALLEVQDAASVLDTQDCEALSTARKQARDHAQDSAGFRSEYMEMARKVKAA